MKSLLSIINQQMKEAFEAKGYDSENVCASISNRPDLCEYQCNSCMALAKRLGAKPIDIATRIVEELSGSDMFINVNAVMPGFINFDIAPSFLAEYIAQMDGDDRCGLAIDENPKTIIVDYGGANAAKPLHVGHLRSAVIGESVKRLGALFGHHMIGDVHLGDWGLQMGLIIEELRMRQPSLAYFDENYKGDYPSEAPFTLGELEEIYPAASKRASEDGEFKDRAHDATLKLQSGYAPYVAIWRHIIDVSVTDLKKNYGALGVEFELWKGESDSEPYIPELIELLTKKGIAYESQGALVVDVTEETDSKELPPCIIRKSDGASLYATSDLATIIEREKLYHPDEYIYITDKRQNMHFVQVFRVAKKAGLVPEDRRLVHIGFGTVNGKNGSALKTRDGGVMRLETLMQEIDDAVYKKITANKEIGENEAREISRVVGLAALKYGDLSNQASKDYIFDIDRFSEFEGNTGPYILYTIVRLNSILNKWKEQGGANTSPADITSPDSKVLKELYLKIASFSDSMLSAYSELAIHRICQYVYSICDIVNAFYHDVKILTCEDKVKQSNYIEIIRLTIKILVISTNVLGLEIPSRM